MFFVISELLSPKCANKELAKTYFIRCMVLVFKHLVSVFNDQFDDLIVMVNT